MTENVIVALLAGSFGLVPVILQWLNTTRQRWDRSTRLNNLRTELEFLERLGTLHVQHEAEDGPTQQQAKFRIRNAVRDLLDQYSALPKDVRPTAGADRRDRRSGEKPSLFKRVLLLYTPTTMLGWVLHSAFYFLLIMILTLLVSDFVSPTYDPETGENEFGDLVGGLIILFSLPLLILQRLARRADRPKTPDAREAGQSEAPDSP